MALKVPLVEHPRSVAHVPHDAQVRVDARVKDIRSRGEAHDAQTAHQAAAKVHEDSAERLYARGERADADEQRELARADRESAGIAAERAQLSRERQRSIEDAED